MRHNRKLKRCMEKSCTQEFYAKGLCKYHYDVKRGKNKKKG